MKGGVCSTHLEYEMGYITERYASNMSNKLQYRFLIMKISENNLAFNLDMGLYILRYNLHNAVPI